VVPVRGAPFANLSTLTFPGGGTQDQELMFLQKITAAFPVLTAVLAAVAPAVLVIAPALPTPVTALCRDLRVGRGSGGPCYGLGGRPAGRRRTVWFDLGNRELRSEAPGPALSAQARNQPERA